MTAYVDYVVANYEGYLSLVKGAASGNEALRRIYDDALAVLTDRVFTEDAHRASCSPTPRPPGWSSAAGPSMSEELVLSWAKDPAGVTREQLDDLLANSLPALVATVDHADPSQTSRKAR